MKKLKKRFLRALALFIVPPIGMLLIRFIYLTCKKNFHITKGIDENPVIFAFWHGDLLMQPYLYYQFRKTPKASVLISDHFDGQIIAKIMVYFNLGTIYGSSNRSAVRVLMQGIRSLKDGYDIGITPDGPKGPRHEVSDGVVAMAHKSKAKVVVFSCVASDYWQLNSWDKFTIAKPFSTLDFYASEPFDLSDVDIEDAKVLIKKELMRHATE
ncbi:MAG: lysophospholipid acyltransferase family protein [Campylobacterota bacterium]|nr:lysophospholipid acyltransferase family protein [Campylobacterota bacterium]